MLLLVPDGHRLDHRAFDVGGVVVRELEGLLDGRLELLAANADVNQAYVSWTPLLVACHRGHAEIVTKLLAANANVDQADNHGATPLIVACQKGHTEVARGSR